MAYTKIHAIKQTLDKALDYIENPEKTDYAMLISGYNIEPECATLEMTLTQIQANNMQGSRVHFNQSGNLAYHMIQSFAPTDNVSPEQAHEIGKRLADEFLGGQYEYVIATHIDKGHIHNHIIFNATSWYTFKKFRTNPAWTAREIRNISDRLCADANLSVIKTKKELGRSYQYVPKKTSYRQLIRQRVRIALQAATSWEEYRNALEKIGVSIDDTGKYTTYKLEGQERGTRDRALGKDGEFSKTAIEEQLASNSNNIARLKAEIVAAVKVADNYDTFIEQLALHGVTTKKERSGVKYFIEDDTGINEWTMGAAYSTDAIKAAIVTGEAFFEDADTVDLIAEHFDRTNRPLADEVMVRVNRQSVLQTTADGVLLAVPDTEKPGRLFVDRSKVKYHEDTDELVVAITAAFKYTAMADDGKSYSLRGEDLIRKLELAAGVQPAVLELDNHDIKSMSAKGVTISLPEYGIDRLFVPAENVEYDDQTLGGAVRVSLWDHWSYSFHALDGKQKYVIGSELIGELEKRQVAIDGSLAGRIRSMQRRNLIADTKQLADTLNLLRRESIEQVDDFDTKIEELRGRSEELKQQIAGIQEKNSQYKLAAKYLMALKQYEPYELELNDKRNPIRKEAYRKEHANELSALQHARHELQAMGVNQNVDPNKVMELVRQQDKEAAELAATSRELMERIVAVQTARKTVQSVQNGNILTKETQRTKTPTR